MDIFKKIATILGVAVIGYFEFYFVCVFYNMIAFLLVEKIVKIQWLYLPQ